MPQNDFGPINIAQGNFAKFVLEFLDANGSITTPSSANLTITYINIGGSSQADTIPLTVVGSYFTGIWSSTSASLGLATWVATAAGSTVTHQTGVIRVIDP